MQGGREQIKDREMSTFPLVCFVLKYINVLGMH